MSKEINDGGAAFPQAKIDRSSVYPFYEQDGGISMRDYFAAKAMQGMLTSHDACDPDAIADRAYVIADAMIKARSNER